MGLHKLLSEKGYVAVKGMNINEISNRVEELHISKNYDFCIIPKSLVPEAPEDLRNSGYVLYLKKEKRDEAGK